MRIIEMKDEMIEKIKTKDEKLKEILENLKNNELEALEQLEIYEGNIDLKTARKLDKLENFIKDVLEILDNLEKFVFLEKKQCCLGLIDLWPRSIAIEIKRKNSKYEITTINNRVKKFTIKSKNDPVADYLQLGDIILEEIEI